MAVTAGRGRDSAGMLDAGHTLWLRDVFLDNRN